MQSKEFEIHLQIGESLVLCVEGVNSNENRDLWTELPKEVSLNLCVFLFNCGRTVVYFPVFIALTRIAHHT